MPPIKTLRFLCLLFSIIITGPLISMLHAPDQNASIPVLTLQHHHHRSTYINVTCP